ncbi:MAG: universal stress protein [Magnetococcales bacterium]|nr:universal stress protein [Magnetococcales bacterium]MBF0584535.1 universal stress protein [Magnetococcales bacterium]
MSHDNFRTLVVAVDFTQDSLAAVKEAFTLGTALESRLHLLHVAYEATVNPDLQYKKKELKKALRPVLEVAADTMKAFVKEHDLAKQAKQAKVGLETLVIHGQPASQIVHTAKKLKADMIVLGYSGTTGLANLLPGATVEKVLQLAEVPVLVVKKR